MLDAFDRVVNVEDRVLYASGITGTIRPAVISKLAIGKGGQEYLCLKICHWSGAKARTITIHSGCGLVILSPTQLKEDLKIKESFEELEKLI